MTERPLIIVYGNCQAEAVYATMTSMPELNTTFDFQYVCSFTVAGQLPAAPLSSETLARTAFVFEQATAKVRFNQLSEVPASSRALTFMSLDFNPLWPLHAVEARSMPEPPEFPFGRFPYGDRAINSVVAAGLTGDGGYRAYVEKSAALLRNVDRVLEMEKRRWSLIEQVNGSNFLEWVLANFASTKLFHTYNHPSQVALAMVAATVLKKSGLISGTADQIAVEVRKYLDFCWRPDFYEVPVHPLIAQTFGLEWWSPDLLYNWAGRQVGYEELIRAQIDWRSISSDAVRAAG